MDQGLSINSPLELPGTETRSTRAGMAGGWSPARNETVRTSSLFSFQVTVSPARMRRVDGKKALMEMVSLASTPPKP